MFKDKISKSVIIYITYAIVLFILLFNIEKVWRGFLFILGVLWPVFIGLALAFILNIPMSFFERRLLGGMDKIKSVRLRRVSKRMLAIVITFVVIVAVVTVIVIFIIPQIRNSIALLAERFPGYTAIFNSWVNGVLNYFMVPDNFWQELTSTFQKTLAQLGNVVIGAVPQILNVTMSVTQSIFNFAMGFVLSVYMLADKEKLLALKDKVMAAYVPDRAAAFLREVGHTANVTFHSFISGQVLEAFILGSLCAIGLAILRVPFALLIGVLVGATSFIPVFGAFLGAVPSAFILLMINPWYCLTFIIYLIALQQFESNIIYPKVIGSSIGMAGMWVLIGMLIGGSLFGFAGVVLGIPTFAVISAVLETMMNRRLAAKEEARDLQDEANIDVNVAVKKLDDREGTSVEVTIDADQDSEEE